MAKTQINSVRSTYVVVKDMFRGLLPATIFATATSSLGSIVNGLLVGNYLSATALAALGFVAPLVAMLGALSALVSGGARIVCGDSMGRRKLEE